MITEYDASIVEAETRAVLMLGRAEAAEMSVKQLRADNARLTAEAKMAAESLNQCKGELFRANGECESLRTRLQAEQISCAALESRLDAERKERARSDTIVREFMAKLTEIMTVEEKEVTVNAADTWQFEIQRDGAFRMVGVTARAKV